MIDTISQQEFDEAIEQYISWASEWDGALPADVFFGIWADLQHRERPVELRVHIVEVSRVLRARHQKMCYLSFFKWMVNITNGVSRWVN